MNCHTRRIFCNFFFSSSFHDIFNASVIFLYFFSLSELTVDQILKIKFHRNKEHRTDFTFFTKLQKLNSTRTFTHESDLFSRRDLQKRGEEKIHRFFILAKITKNLTTSGRGRVPGPAGTGRSVRYEGRAGGSSSLLVLMKIHGISLTQLVFRVREPVVVHRPWFAARFNLQTKREGTVCVASIRWLCWSAASSPMSVPTTAKCACFFVYSYPRILVHGLILPGRRFVSHIFIPNISLSSFRFFFLFFFFPFFLLLLLLFSLRGRRDRVFIISECSGEACNFTEFYRSNFISCVRGPRIRVAKSGLEHG